MSENNTPGTGTNRPGTPLNAASAAVISDADTCSASAAPVPQLQRDFSWTCTLHPRRADVRCLSYGRESDAYAPSPSDMQQKYIRRNAPAPQNV